MVTDDDGDRRRGAQDRQSRVQRRRIAGPGRRGRPDRRRRARRCGSRCRWRTLSGEKCTTIDGLVDGTALRAAAAVPARRHAARVGLPDPGRRRGPRRGRRPGESRAGRTSLIPAWIASCSGTCASAWTSSTSSVPTSVTRDCGHDWRPRRGEAWSRIAPLDDVLPRQAAHLDLTDANVVVSRDAGGPHPDGVIDFGDLSHTWAVSELAITASSVLGHPGAELDLDPAGDPGLSRDPAAVGGRGRRAVAAAGAAHRRTDRQRCPAGRARSRTTTTSPSSPTRRRGCSNWPPRFRST